MTSKLCCRINHTGVGESKSQLPAVLVGNAYDPAAPKVWLSCCGMRSFFTASGWPDLTTSMAKAPAM